MMPKVSKEDNCTGVSVVIALVVSSQCQLTNEYAGILAIVKQLKKLVSILLNLDRSRNPPMQELQASHQRLSQHLFGSVR